ncbi:MAG: hypothetical protein LBG09_01990 [Puniceicoccales bacterium]|nr:hypothetical protein [Puniceicoccales bacterium]
MKEVKFVTLLRDFMNKSKVINRMLGMMTAISGMNALTVSTLTAGEGIPYERAPGRVTIGLRPKEIYGRWHSEAEMLAERSGQPYSMPPRGTKISKKTGLPVLTGNTPYTRVRKEFPEEERMRGLWTLSNRLSESAQSLAKGVEKNGSPVARVLRALENMVRDISSSYGLNPKDEAVAVLLQEAKLICLGNVLSTTKVIDGGVEMSMNAGLVKKRKPGDKFYPLEIIPGGKTVNLSETDKQVVIDALDFLINDSQLPDWRKEQAREILAHAEQEGLLSPALETTDDAEDKPSDVNLSDVHEIPPPPPPPPPPFRK